MKSRNNEMEIDLLELFRVWKKKLWLIILVTFLGGTVGFAFSKIALTPMYTSTSMMYAVSKETYQLSEGTFHVDRVDPELVTKIPGPLQMGKVYERLIHDTKQPGESEVDGIIRVYNHEICDVISLSDRKSTRLNSSHTT